MKYNVRYITPFDPEIELIIYFPSDIEKDENKYRWNCNIIKFKWGNGVYDVIEQISDYENNEGNNPVVNYTLKAHCKKLCSTPIVQIQIDKKSLKCMLIKISTAHA
jgi:hypothetical protein